MRTAATGLMWALGLLISTAAHAQTVEGTVFGDNSDRLKGATVRLERIPDGSPVDVATAGEGGAYKSGTLVAGQFRVDVSASGYDSVQRVITVGATGSIRQDFVLRERQFLIQLGPRSGIDVTLAQPGTFTFFDTGTDEPGELDIFTDGELTASIQLIGMDVIGFTDHSQRLRFGANFGVGMGTAKEPAPTAADPEATRDTRVLLGSIAGIIDFAKVVRFEAGYVKGVSAREGGTLDQRDDGAIFVGLSLRTQLGSEFMKIFR